jgi:hypothetical protein
VLSVDNRDRVERADVTGYPTADRTRAALQAARAGCRGADYRAPAPARARPRAGLRPRAGPQWQFQGVDTSPDLWQVSRNCAL